MEKNSLFKLSKIRVIILILCLGITGAIIYFQPDPVEINRETTLQQALLTIPGWENHNPDEIDAKIVETLKLDDYFNQSFFKKGEKVSLYIGYYTSSRKVGAAHDPTVCFPGQGWVLYDKTKGKVNFKNKAVNPISYSMMVAQSGDTKQLIIYWFQSYDIANSDTFSQKITLAWKKLLHQGEDNAFVRIITPIENRSSIQAGQETILDFINSFYPVFLDYIKKPYKIEK